MANANVCFTAELLARRSIGRNDISILESAPVVLEASLALSW